MSEAEDVLETAKACDLSEVSATPAQPSSEADKVTLLRRLSLDLIDDELVVRLIAVEGVDHPVAIEPDAALLVFFVAVGIGVTGGV